jgi:hypothetical protein
MGMEIGWKNLRPAKKGETRNPNGRPAAGTTVREFINSLAFSKLTEKQLRRVAKDKKMPWAKRTAANRMLRTLEAPDMADFEKILNGEETLSQARDKGLNTDAIKRIRPTKEGIEIELHDRSGSDFDRILDRTIGKPMQEISMTGKDGGPLKTHTEVTHTIDYDDLSKKLDEITANRADRRLDPRDGGDDRSEQDLSSACVQPATDAVPVAPDNA